MTTQEIALTYLVAGYLISLYVCFAVTINRMQINDKPINLFGYIVIVLFVVPLWLPIVLLGLYLKHINKNEA